MNRSLRSMVPALLLTLAVLASACGEETPTLDDVTGAVESAADEVIGDEPAEEEPAAEEEGEAELAFTYEGDRGPENWASLTSDNACAGSAQSPVDIAGVTPVDAEDLQISYSPTAVNIKNSGHNVQIDYDAGSTLGFGGETYNLAQFHAHSPSEHTLEGQSFPMEIHLVHTLGADRFAVVGLLVQEGEANAALAPFFDNIPLEISEAATTIDGASVNIADALPSPLDTYRYTGSFTTPPCTEGVLWFMAATPITASAEQIAAFMAAHDGNNRPVQPINDREIGLDSAAG